MHVCGLFNDYVNNYPKHVYFWNTKCRSRSPAEEQQAGGAEVGTIEVEILAGVPANGLVIIECKMGKLLSNWRPVVVTSDALLAAELQAILQDDSDDSSMDELLRDFGLWLEYIEVSGHRRAGAGTGAGATTTQQAVGTTGPSTAASRTSAKAEGSCDFSTDLERLYSSERYKQHMAGLGLSLLEFAVDRCVMY